MFMDKEELRYTIKLYKAKKGYKQTLNNPNASKFNKIIRIVIIILAITYAIATTFSGVFSSDFNSIRTIVPFSSFTNVIILGVILSMVGISFFNLSASWSYYPQTVKTRYFSNILMIFRYCSILTLVLFVYLNFSYLLSFILSNYIPNAHLVTEYNLTVMLLNTLLTFIFYIFISSIILFVLSLIRKFKLYTLSVPIIIIAMGFIDYDSLLNLYKRVVLFFSDESSIGILIAKMLIVAIILFIASYSLEKFTLYGEKISYSKVAVTILVLISFSISSTVFFYDVPRTSEEFRSYTAKTGSITIDTSSFEKPAYIKILGNENIKINEEYNYGEYEYEDEIYLFISTEFNNNTMILQSDELTFTYELYNSNEFYDEIDFDISKYLNDNLTATVGDDTITLNFSYDKGVNLLMPSYNILFKNLDIFNQYNLPQSEIILRVNNLVYYDNYH